MFPVVIKAIQDLADDVDALRARVDALEAIN
jgi:ubiquinone biosynthesis protein UbiJ